MALNISAVSCWNRLRAVTSWLNSSIRGSPDCLLTITLIKCVPLIRCVHSTASRLNITNSREELREAMRKITTAEDIIARDFSSLCVAITPRNLQPDRQPIFLYLCLTEFVMAECSLQRELERAVQLAFALSGTQTTSAAPKRAPTPFGVSAVLKPSPPNAWWNFGSSLLICACAVLPAFFALAGEGTNGPPFMLNTKMIQR